MSDIFDQIQPDSQGDIFDQIAPTRQVIRSAPLAALRSVAEAIPGTTFATQYYLKGGPFNPRAIEQARQVVEPIEQAGTEGLSAKIGEAGGAILPFLGLSAPFMAGARILPKVIPPIAKTALGLGSYEAAKQGLSGGSPVQGFGQGALAGALFHGGGRIGATLAPRNALGQRIGTAIGMGATGAATAPKEDRFIAGAMGLGLGALSPSRPLGKTKSQYLGEAINEYRTILRPEKRSIKNIEIRKGKNINDYYKLAAEEQLPIKQSSDKKTLDTLEAREALEPKQSAIHERLNKQLEANPAKQFDLFEIGRKAKTELRQAIKNDTEYKSAVEDVNKFINDAIEFRGRYLNGQELNDFKKGMWSVSYNQLQPNTQNTARKIGFIAKESIENAYPKSSIKELNELSGKYATLNNLLQEAHGRVVSGGQIGRRFAETTGALAGLKIPFVGPIAGRYAGGKVSDYLYAPERASSIAAKKAQKAGIVGESFRRTMGQAFGVDPMRTIPTPNIPAGIPYQTRALPPPPSYRPTGYPSGAPPQKPMITPYQGGGPVIQGQAPYRGTILPAIAPQPPQPRVRLTPEQIRKQIGMKIKKGGLLRPAGESKVLPKEIIEKPSRKALGLAGLATALTAGKAEAGETLDPKYKQQIANAENYGKTTGDWAQVEDIVLRDLKRIGKLKQNITLEQVRKDPQLYEKVVKLYWDRLDAFGIPEKDKALWWLMPGRYRQTGGDISRLKNPEHRNIMQNRIKNIGRGK